MTDHSSPENAVPVMDLVQRLRAQVTDDHVRGCDGRCYSCDCGYDQSTEGLLEVAADEIERLRSLIRAQQMPDLRLQKYRDLLEACADALAGSEYASDQRLSEEVSLALTSPESQP